MYRLLLSLLTCALLIPTESAICLNYRAHTMRPYTPIIANVSNNNDIRSIAQSITVKILVGNTAATGFIIAKDGKALTPNPSPTGEGGHNAYTVVTNAHVVSRSGAYQIKAPDGTIYPAILTYKDNSSTGNERALIKFSSTQSFSVAELGNSANLSESEEVKSAGFPYDSNELVFNRKYEKALSDFSKAIDINPQLAEAYGNRGILYAQMGNKQQAIQNLQTAAELFRQQGNIGAYEYTIGILQQL